MVWQGKKKKSHYRGNSESTHLHTLERIFWDIFGSLIRFGSRVSVVYYDWDIFHKETKHKGNFDKKEEKKNTNVSNKI